MDRRKWKFMAAGLSPQKLTGCEDITLRLQLKCGHRDLNRWRSRAGCEFAQSLELKTERCTIAETNHLYCPQPRRHRCQKGKWGN
jgi:hypothetical protein